jgi:hypothetical protein
MKLKTYLKIKSKIITKTGYTQAFDNLNIRQFADIYNNLKYWNSLCHLCLSNGEISYHYEIDSENYIRCSFCGDFSGF